MSKAEDEARQWSRGPEPSPNVEGGGGRGRGERKEREGSRKRRIERFGRVVAGRGGRRDVRAS